MTVDQYLKEQTQKSREMDTFIITNKGKRKKIPKSLKFQRYQFSTERYIDALREKSKENSQEIFRNLFNGKEEKSNDQ